MAKSLLLSTLIISGNLGGAQAFSSRLGGSSAIGLNSISPTSTKTKVFSYPITDDNDNSSTALHKRRAFLSNLVASSLLPILTLTNPSVASARGGVVNDKGPIVFGDDDIMSQKEHGTTSMPVQENLRYGVSRKLADKISSYNRVFAEMGGYFEGSTSFEKDVRQIVANTGEPVTFFDSVSGKPLFKAPINRSVDDFINESKVHGWPSFRDEEVVWDNVRVLKSSGETVSTVGTHLGHNLPDRNGNRYCINLVSIAGNPAR